jgi:hypothetical protein
LGFLVLAGSMLLRSEEANAVDKSLHVLAGPGFSFSDEDDTGSETAEGEGGFGQVEFVLNVTRWFSPRAYGGLHRTWPDRTSCGLESPCDVSTRVGFAGVKLHAMIPIPYVGPFLEIGLGGSVGTISTRIGTLYDRHNDGFMYHIPFALGLALGETHSLEVSFSFLFYPSYGQATGALAFGIGFPL